MNRQQDLRGGNSCFVVSISGLPERGWTRNTTPSTLTSLCMPSVQIHNAVPNPSILMENIHTAVVQSESHALYVFSFQPTCHSLLSHCPVTPSGQCRNPPKWLPTFGLSSPEAHAVAWWPPPSVIRTSKPQERHSLSQLRHFIWDDLIRSIINCTKKTIRARSNY